MIQYPLQFPVSASTEAGIATPWRTEFHSNGLPILSKVVIPQEFEGPGGGYSPEDFFSAALINCFVATFKVVAEKSKLEFSNLNCEGVLTVDRNDEKVPMMKSFRLAGHLTGVTDVERARRILEKTSQSCMILNSVKTELTFEWSVSPS